MFGELQNTSEPDPVQPSCRMSGFDTARSAASSAAGATFTFPTARAYTDAREDGGAMLGRVIAAVLVAAAVSAAAAAQDVKLSEIEFGRYHAGDPRGGNE